MHTKSPSGWQTSVGGVSNLTPDLVVFSESLSGHFFLEVREGSEQQLACINKGRNIGLLARTFLQHLFLHRGM
jgi:hypothetical protein